MHHIKQLTLTLVLIGLTFIIVQAQTDEIKTYMDAMEVNGFSGSLLVAKDGKVIHKAGYGLADVESNVKNISSTVFTTGSITKQFTGAAILKLEMMGKLNVTDLMSKYIDNVPGDKSMITLHQLLIHASGFAGAIGRDDELTGADAFLSNAFAQELLFTPGSKHRYSNVGYSILGIIIEKVSGMTYESFLNKYLFSPAGMKKTGYIFPHYSTDELAVGYSRNGEKWGRVTEKNWGEDGPGWHLKGNGGIHSTVEDMYKWHLALLGNKILSDEAKGKWYARHIEEGEGADTYYGYGWAIFPTPRNTDLITHNGGNGIFFADMLRYLTENIAIIIMTNNAQRKFEDIAFNIAGILLVPDFSPRIRDGQDEASADDEMMMESLGLNFFKVISQDEKSLWESFIVENTTVEFQKMADMEYHMEMFGQIHEALKGQQPVEAELQKGEAIITMSNGVNVVLGFEKNKNGKMLIGGIGVD